MSHFRLLQSCFITCGKFARQKEMLHVLEWEHFILPKMDTFDVRFPDALKMVDTEMFKISSRRFRNRLHYSTLFQNRKF